MTYAIQHQFLYAFCSKELKSLTLKIATNRHYSRSLARENEGEWKKGREEKGREGRERRVKINWDNYKVGDDDILMKLRVG